jgi:type 1 glutamine amidotransferase
VKRPTPEELSLVEREFIALTQDHFEVIATQDCVQINPEMLSKVVAVAFYTTGELPISAQNRAAFMAWMKAGGAFVGMHCATDTLYEYPPYLRMLGGVFNGHPWHETVQIEVLDGTHPSTGNLARGFAITDEIYQFRDWDPTPLHELLRLGSGNGVDLKKGARTDGNYAVSWCREYGAGRVFYTSLGHRPEVWTDSRFRQHLLGGLFWAAHGADWRAAPPQGSQRLLTGGEALSAWTQRDGSAAAWKLAPEAVIEVAPGRGDIRSREEFADARLHIEFQVPLESGEGQAKGNSGVYLMGRYELQVLDSLGKTPGVGDCAAIYGARAPDENACTAPGSWQSYDIRWRAPRFAADGKKTANARLSLWHNGILVHNDVELSAVTPGGLGEDEVARGPLLLQEHASPVRYRNIWWLAD